VRNIITVLTLL